MDSTYSPEPTAPRPAAPHPRPGRRRRTAVGIAGALALVLGSGVAGLAIGRSDAGGSTASRQPTSFGAAGPATGGMAPFEQGSGSLRGLGTASSTARSTTATAAQITGLVRIQTTLGYENGEGAGTGMVLTGDGEVLTNHHVVEGATKITATVMSTGKSYSATVVGTDAKADVAVLRLEGASGLSTVKTDTVLPAAGAKVTAVGDANGTTDHLTASAGRVVALGRTVTTSGEGESSETLQGLIEIAAGVVGGDSGGAVYDGQGEVVGMTTAASTTAAVGFAIPIRTALTIAADLESHVTGSDYSYGRPAFLGVGLAASGTDVTRTIAGVYSGTPAAAAGLAAGDTITRVDGIRVSTGSQLQKAIGAHSPGDSVVITYTGANGRSHTTTVTLMEGPVS